MFCRTEPVLLLKMLSASRIKSGLLTRGSFSIWPQPNFPVSASGKSPPGLWSLEQLPWFSEKAIYLQAPSPLLKLFPPLRKVFPTGFSAGRTAVLCTAPAKMFPILQSHLCLQYNRSPHVLPALCMNTLFGSDHTQTLSDFSHSVILSTVPGTTAGVQSTLTEGTGNPTTVNFILRVPITEPGSGTQGKRVPWRTRLEY